MDYIIRQLDKRIIYSEAANKTRDTAEYYRVKIEYGLIFLMTVLWNQNITKVDAEAKEHIFGKVRMPSVGSILDISRRLDINRLVFNDKKLVEAVNSYPQVRNERIGHGYTFEDNLAELVSAFKRISNTIYSASTSLRTEYDLIIVESCVDGKYSGMNYKADGATFLPWACPAEVAEFQVGHVYTRQESNQYYRLSPFIHITNNEEFFLFKDVEEFLTGRLRYNRLLKTENFVKEWPEMSNISLENDAFRRKSLNQTIISTIKANYKRYIEIGALKKKITGFLLNDKASVCATIWGHGGVGKTATVQSVCEDLANGKTRKFDYIIFASAKDRYYNYYTGSIETISENVNSFDELIRSINRVMFDNSSNDTQGIIDTDGKVLIVIDDYETFHSSEKLKIESFIRQLDINHHKVLVTTRANLIIGDEFQTNELDASETKSFLLEILKSEFDEYRMENFAHDLSESNKYYQVHAITSGRPLFVYQFAFIWMQSGNLNQALSRPIGQEKSAIDFLYGRIYDYFSPQAQDVFVAMGQVVTDDDPTNLIEKVRYILNLEDNDKFDATIQELEKLRIIEVIEARFFKVYSKEILSMMSVFFSKKPDSFRRSVISRTQEVTRNKKLDNEAALLNNANTARTSKNEDEVVRLYRSILNREMSPPNIKIQAILNLAEYLYNSRGKPEETIKLFKDYEHLFSLDPSFSRMHAIYSWATGRQEDCLQLLLELFAKRPQGLLDKPYLRIELRGMLLTYRGIDAIQQREELKDKRRFGEIRESDFSVEYQKTKALFGEICEKQGKILFNELEKLTDFNDLPSGARQFAATGLYQYVNLNIRLNRYQEAIDLCNYVVGNFPSHYHEQFIVKRNSLLRQQEYSQ